MKVSNIELSSSVTVSTLIVQTKYGYSSNPQCNLLCDGPLYQPYLEVRHLFMLFLYTVHHTKQPTSRDRTIL